VPRTGRPWSRAQWIPIVALAVILAVVLVIALSGSGPPTTGYDISYPQCGGSYPAKPLFAVIGVNGGFANNANPCVSPELSWARAAPGQKRPRQPPVSLYIDTSNPGADRVGDWPRSGNALSYGACNGRLTDACSFIYGEQRAAHSYSIVAALGPLVARSAPWWLDVELQASWAGTYELNIAALRGFLAGLQNAGANGPIGLYSTRAQWREITGLTAQTTPTAFGRLLPEWIAGIGATQSQARQNCARGDFTGVAPTLAQYRIGRFDADLRCAGSP
jgi:hypothetical protein